MITFKHFIDAQCSPVLSEDGPELTFAEFVKVVKAECRPFLNSIDYLPLLRGTKHTDISFGRDPQPTNRKPVDSGDTFNYMFNLGVYSAFGIENVRKTSVFATGDRSVASGYGRVNFIFPIGDFEYLWADRIRDSYAREDYIYRSIMRRSGVDLGLQTAQYALGLELLLTDCMKANKDPKAFVNGDESIKKAITQFKEESPIIDPHEDLYNKVNDGIEDFFKSTYYKNTGLDEAIEQKCEILIYKGNGYYYADPVQLRKSLGLEPVTPYSAIWNALRDQLR